MNLKQLLQKVGAFVRWRDWGPGKIPVLLSLGFYIGLSDQLISAVFLLRVGLFFYYALLHSALGYVANDWGDRDLDRRQGKPNVFLNLSLGQGIIALTMLFLFALMSGVPFIGQPGFVILWLLWIFFALGYSLPPVRLKEKGTLGLSVSAVAQWTLPLLLTFAALGDLGGWDMWALVVAYTISGATLEVAHQRHDQLRDRETGAGTLGARASTGKMDKLYRIALFLDKLAVGLVCLVVWLNLGQWVIFSFRFPVGLPLFLLYLLFLVLALVEMARGEPGVVVEPYYTQGHSATKLLHETLPNLGIPAYLLFLACLQNMYMWGPLIVFLFWRLVLGQADWLWPLRALYNRLRQPAPE
jgi:4-hydroxybenzoate polyprenyltransferase